MKGLYRKYFLVTTGIFVMLPLLSGCWYVAAAGAGAYGGYKAKEAGYSLQSPVKKDGAATKKGAAKQAEDKDKQ